MIIFSFSSLCLFAISTLQDFLKFPLHSFFSISRILFGSFGFPCLFHNLIDVRINRRLAEISGVQTFNFGFEVHCLRLGIISLAAWLNTLVRLLITVSACFILSLI